MKKQNKLLISILSFLFIVILFLMKMDKTIEFDTKIYNLIINLKNDKFTEVVKIITNFGDTICIISIIFLCFIFFKNKFYPKIITLNIIGIVLINQFLKHLIQRPRPNFMHLIKENGFSFPSGHSMAAFGFYGLFIYLIYKSNLNKKIKILFIFLLSILIFLIGMSRIYLGVHYFTDVLAGFIMSYIYLIIFTYLIKKYQKNE